MRLDLRVADLWTRIEKGQLHILPAFHKTRIVIAESCGHRIDGRYHGRRRRRYAVAARQQCQESLAVVCQAANFGMSAL